MEEIIGQILSIVAVVLGFISFQMKTPRGILIFQLFTALVFSVHYLLIGAMSAAGLNFIAAIKCLCFYFRDKNETKGVAVPIIFTLLVIVTSILTWDGWYSTFIMAGLTILTISYAFSAQTIRKMNLIKSPLCLVYNICVLSVGGIIYETATFISTIIALIKDKKERKKEGVNTVEIEQ